MNPRRRKPTDLESAPFDRSGISSEHGLTEKFSYKKLWIYYRNNYIGEIYEGLEILNKKLNGENSFDLGEGVKFK